MGTSELNYILYNQLKIYIVSVCYSDSGGDIIPEDVRCRWCHWSRKRTFEMSRNIDSSIRNLVKLISLNLFTNLLQGLYVYISCAKKETDRVNSLTHSRAILILINIHTYRTNNRNKNSKTTSCIANSPREATVVLSLV